MKHHSYSYLLLLGLFRFFVQCTKPDEHAGHISVGQEAAEEYYTCPMHPSVRSDRPGACPVCNMALVKVTGNQSGKEGFRLTAWQRQLANIEIMPVKATGGSTCSRFGRKELISEIFERNYQLLPGKSCYYGV